jgi:hypothetical protein
MYPTIHHELMKARAADLHRQAERDRIARAAIQARRARHHGKHPAAMMTRTRLAIGAAAAALALVWALAACGSVAGSSSGTQAHQARPLSPQHVLQAGSQSGISDLANLKRDHTDARPSREASPQDMPGLGAVKDLATVKRDAMLRIAWAVWARTR